MPGVDVHRAPASDDHDAGPLLQHLEVVTQVDVGEVLDDDVEAGAEVLDHLLLVGLVVVVEDVVRPALGHHVHAVLSPRRPHHRRADSSAHNERKIKLIGMFLLANEKRSGLKWYQSINQ